jgi:flavin reductase (DIM6/NTAB) family NADH-FMN oxidoreductase RutF
MHAGLQQLPEGPVYLVSTEFEGKRNIMSVAVFAYMSGRLVSIGVAPSRYSFGLIRKSGVYVVNVVDKGLVEAVRICGENSGRNVDKFKLAGLTPVKASKVNAPIIQESPVSLECKVFKEIEVGGHVWFIAEVQAAHVREGYDWKDGLLLKWIGARRLSH